MTSSGTENDPQVAALVRDAIDLVVVIARQLRRHFAGRVELDELASFGHEGLIHAARSYKAELGVPFRRWANLRIRGAILDGVRAQAELPRDIYRRLAALDAGDRVQEDLMERDAAAPAGSAEEADRRLDSYMAGIATAMALGLVGEEKAEGAVLDKGENAEETLGREELVRAIRAGIDERPDDERQLLNLVYFEDLSVAEAGKRLGLSKSWACRVHGRAIEGLSKYLRRNRAV